MSEENEPLKNLIGKPLNLFRIVEMTEVCQTNEDGVYVGTLGFLKNPHIAQGFLEMQKDVGYHNTEKRLVLTDGKVGYYLGKTEPVKLLDDEAEALKIRQHAVAGLSQAQRRILGV